MNDQQGPERPTRWFNRSTVGASLASLFSDISHELATAVLPMVLLSVGAGPAALGIIEGAADGFSSLAKFWGGVAADRVQRRKPLAAVGYLVTALGTFGMGFVSQAWHLAALRVIAWVGRGSRSAPRDVLVSENAPLLSQGKAFGMERAGDAVGAVLGPLAALALMSQGVQAQHVMQWSLLPGLIAFLAIVLLVVERPNVVAARRPSLRASFDGMGRPFRRYLVGILIFGSGDFSRTLLILFATTHVTGELFSLEGATLAISLYVLHNAVSAIAALPLGALSDRLGARRVVTAGYVLAVATTISFAVLPPNAPIIALLFVCSGIYVAAEEVAEKASAAELLPREVKGAGMGLLGATNGIGDMISSALVGTLWAIFPEQPAIGFAAAAGLQAVGALVIATAPR